MQIEDTEIVQWIKSGSNVEQAYRVIMSRYQERLYWHIRKMLGNHDDAADVLQNTFIKAFKGMSKFNEEASLYTWLYRIATNESLTQLGKRKRMVQLEDLEGSAAALRSTEEQIDSAKVEALLTEAIDALPPKQQKVFRLRYYDEMPYNDMSSLLGTSVGALKASYHHAVKKIEAQLISQF